jgi:hypothetical protein
MKVCGKLSITDKETATERQRLSVRVFHHEEDGRAKRFLGNILSSLRNCRFCSEEQEKRQTLVTERCSFHFLIGFSFLSPSFPLKMRAIMSLKKTRAVSFSR